MERIEKTGKLWSMELHRTDEEQKRTDENRTAQKKNRTAENRTE